MQNVNMTMSEIDQYARKTSHSQAPTETIFRVGNSPHQGAASSRNKSHDQFFTGRKFDQTRKGQTQGRPEQAGQSGKGHDRGSRRGAWRHAADA